jgi:zinc finger-like protein
MCCVVQVVLAWLKGGNRIVDAYDIPKANTDPESAAWAAIDSRVAGDLAMTWALDGESSVIKEDLQNKSLKSGPLVSPLKELLYWHNAIRKELQEIAKEAAQIQSLGALSPAKLTAFIERSQFLADVCNFQR